MCAECTSFRTQVQALLEENAAVLERYEITERGRYAAEREVRRLKAALHGSTSPESTRVKDVCDYHDELWRKAFPNARGLSYPMDGKNAGAVRRTLRWGFKVEEIKRVLDGAFASEFHRSKPQYLYLASILGDENKIRNHLTRLEPEAVEATIQASVRRLSTVLPSWEDPVEAMLAALTSLGLSWKGSPNGSSWTAQCPAHEDRNPSLSVSWNAAGDKLRVKCWAGCEDTDVMAALRLPLSLLFRRERNAA